MQVKDSYYFFQVSLWSTAWFITTRIYADHGMLTDEFQPSQGVRRCLIEIIMSKFKFKDEYIEEGRDPRKKDPHFKSP